MDTDRWGFVTSEEREQVPIYWVGDADVSGTLGVLEKRIAAPTIREFEKWLRKIGARVDASRGKGSHRSFIWNGKPGLYEVSGDRLARKTAVSLARLFELSGPHELFEHVQRRTAPTTR
jgi:hypothetical protein